MVILCTRGYEQKHVCLCVICIHGQVCAVCLLGSLCLPKTERFHCAVEIFAFEIRQHRWGINQHSLNTSYCSGTHTFTYTHKHRGTCSSTEHIKLTDRKIYLTSKGIQSHSDLSYIGFLPCDWLSKLELTADLKCLLSVELSIKLWHCSASIDTPTGQGLKQWLWCWAVGAGGCSVISLVNQSLASG